MEKFGGLINTSFFDASTIAGTLKQKGLIEFTNDYPGPNGLLVSALGKSVLGEAEAKSAEPFDMLDSTILQQLSGGKRLPVELGNSLNLRSKDLAFRLYKLYRQNYIIYDLKNGGVELLLTEGGFLKIKNIMPASAPNIAQPAKQAASPLGKILVGSPQEPAAQGEQTAEVKAHGSRRILWIFVAVIVIAVAGYVVMTNFIGV
ncbi:MAG: hypothetical protein KGH54_00605 [Candidatus Micrarchaeota archaeon]|nr:hypothetical protein [Candidatus Micrarchaeota archaeon]